MEGVEEENEELIWDDDEDNEYEKVEEVEEKRGKII